MQHEQIDETTQQHLVALIQANFVGRDELNAAADAMDSQTLATICRRLADDLANNAIELQQLALANGIDNVDISEVGAQLQAELTEMLQKAEGDQAVLEEAEECEQLVEQEYDDAIAHADSPAIADVLKHQREKVEFGIGVTHELRAADSGEAS